MLQNHIFKHELGCDVGQKNFLTLVYSTSNLVMSDYIRLYILHSNCFPSLWVTTGLMRSFSRLECCCRHRYIRPYDVHWLAGVTLTSIQFRWMSASLVQPVMYSTQVKLWQLLSSGLSVRDMLESQWEEKGSSGRWIITINAHARAHTPQIIPNRDRVHPMQFYFSASSGNPANQSCSWEMCPLANAVIQRWITPPQYISLTAFSWGLSHPLNKSHSCHVGPRPVTPRCCMPALGSLKSVSACARLCESALSVSPWIIVYQLSSATRLIC